jgi:ribokinase
MKILVYGSANIDMSFRVDHIAAAGETINAHSLSKSAGGKGANQAASLAKAGLPVYFAGKVGADGRFLLDLLGSYGADTGNVVEYEGHTGQAFIQVDRHGQNAILVYPGGNGSITVDEIKKTLGTFEKGDVLVLQNEIVHTAELMEEAKKRGMKIYINPSPFDERVNALPLDAADVFFVNEIEAAALAGLPANTPCPKMLDALAGKFPNSEIILTAGKDGAYYGCGAVRAKGEIVASPVVDTVGAGDTFTGYYIAARCRDYAVPAALALACKAASIAVSRAGAMEAMPFAEEVFG